MQYAMQYKMHCGAKYLIHILHIKLWFTAHHRPKYIFQSVTRRWKKVIEIHKIKITNSKNGGNNKYVCQHMPKWQQLYSIFLLEIPLCSPWGNTTGFDWCINSVKACAGLLFETQVRRSTPILFTNHISTFQKAIRQNTITQRSCERHANKAANTH